MHQAIQQQGLTAHGVGAEEDRLLHHLVDEVPQLPGPVLEGVQRPVWVRPAGSASAGLQVGALMAACWSAMLDHHCAGAMQCEPPH